MIKKLTRTGNSVALVLDKPLLEELGRSIPGLRLKVVDS